MEQISRREAMGFLAMLAAMAAQADVRALAQAVQNSPTGTAVDVAGYWSNFYDDTITKGRKALAAEKRKTLYVQADDSNKPLAFADTIPINTLPAWQGDVRVKLAVSQYRPGKGDVSTDVSHLRIDAAQHADPMNILAPLSWAAIASLTPTNAMGKLATLDQLGFKAQQDAAGTDLRNLTLTNGLGNLAINVTRPANPTFTQILKSSSTIVSAALSVMALPAISVPAIKVVTELFGKWQSHATVIMNGNLTPVVATSKLASGVQMPQDPMALKTGYYVMLPEAHKEELAADFEQLTIFNGFLVRRDAPAGQDLVARAQAAVQGVSYATLRIYVDQAPAANCGKTA
ncbi:MAG TPA: hypothetical protein VG267_07670 [Terracidiphilus sp.]|jgi:hypothetical protein|nr:hypothetical protein [Terracidiphilus sp.]